ncbi:MAG: zinc ribbon domain-containing protein [Armatimonadetes bacterium]|nr:zinc ribbon domain-containing protein [Armatimonadota bacterium]
MLCVNCGHDNPDSAATCEKCQTKISAQMGEIQEVIERLTILMKEDPDPKPKVEYVAGGEPRTVTSDHVRTPSVRPVLEHGEALLQGEGSAETFKEALDRLSRRITLAASHYPETRELLKTYDDSIAGRLRQLLDDVIEKYQEAFAQTYKYFETNDLNDLRNGLEAIQVADDSLFSIYNMIGDSLKQMEKGDAPT